MDQHAPMTPPGEPDPQSAALPAAKAPAVKAAAKAPVKTGLLTVFLVLFTDLVGFSIIFPLYAEMLSWYGAHDQGLLHWGMDLAERIFPGHTAVQRETLFGGLLGGVYAGLQFLAAPVWGRISDRHGRRPVLLLSITGTTIAYALWIFAGDFTVLLLSRLVAGVMTGNVAVANAAVADLTSPEKRSRAMAVIGMAFGLGFVIGPALGGLSGHYFKLVDPPGWLNPFSVPAGIACALSLFNLFWAVTRFHETLPPEQRSQAPAPARTIDPTQMFSRALGAGVAAVNTSFLLYTLLFSGMETTLVFLASERLAWGPRDLGYAFVWMGFLSVLAQGALFRPLVPKVGNRVLALIGLALVIPGFAALGAVDAWPHPAVMIAGMSLLALGTGLIFPSLNALASLAGDPARQGWVMGTFRSAGALGRALGPLIAGIAYTNWRAAPYFIGALGMLLPMALLFRWKGPAGRGGPG